MAARRAFRTPASIREEIITRDMLVAYLRGKGFRNIRDNRDRHGSAISQTVDATAPDGVDVRMRVRLCWRRDRGKPRAAGYSAAQLMARITNGDWEGSIQAKIDIQHSEGVTHMLLVQRDGRRISLAALIPLKEVLGIWRTQRDVSAALIKEGRLGRRRKNHAMNGTSPTLWLQDDRAPEVAAALWNHTGVIDLEYGPATPPHARSSIAVDDTFDDLPGLDSSLLGSDKSRRVVIQRSYVARDPRVRKAVLSRALGACERTKCGERRDYPGFLDVHHVLGVAKSDRVNNCVAVCPNCHREAHFAPNRDELNADLLAVAQRRSNVNASSSH
jgi:5-methylcytosine-specific restriction protein A